MKRNNFANAYVNQWNIIYHYCYYYLPGLQILHDSESHLGLPIGEDRPILNDDDDDDDDDVEARLFGVDTGLGENCRFTAK